MSSSGSSFDKIQFIEDICTNIGPRLGTSSAEREAGDLIEKRMAEFCDSTVQEEFDTHPRAFLDFIWITFGFFVLGVICYPFIPLLTATFIVIGLLLFLAQQPLLWEVVDPLFPKKTSTNVIGKIKAANEPKGILLLGAHHDSAYEFPLFSMLGKRGSLVITITVVLSVFAAVLTIGKSIMIILANPVLGLIVDVFTTPTLIIALILVGIVALTLRSNKVVPGANDNLSAVAVILEAGEKLAKNPPKNLDVWLVSFGCEENMRGSKRFATRHKEELQGPFDILLNFDSVGAGELRIVKGESMYFAKHSEKAVKIAEEAAHKLGLDIPVESMSFAGTDSANFSRKKLKAVSVLAFDSHGMPTGWHTMRDTPEILDSKVLDQSVELALSFVSVLDKESTKI